jgi:type IV secretion system protein VirD4
MKDQFNNAVGPQVRGSTPKAGKLIPALVVVSLAAGLQSATQFFAHDFGYQAALGGHFEHLYVPWSILQWAGQWYRQYPDAIMRAGSIGMTVSARACSAWLLPRWFWRTRPSSIRTCMVQHAGRTCRTSRLPGCCRGRVASGRLLTGKALPTSAGVYVGAWLDKRGKQRYLRHNGPEHVLCYAPTRSGKGVGLVMPTLLSWGESAVITDLKGELWSLTAGWRRQHAQNKVLRFEPASASGSVCWNPLDEIRTAPKTRLATCRTWRPLIVDPDGKRPRIALAENRPGIAGRRDPACALQGRNEGTAATLPAVDALLADPDRDIAELWMEMRTYGHIDGENHPAVGSAARDMMDRPDEEAGSVLSTAKSYLALYRDPIVARNISRSEFNIRDLMHHEQPVSLYILTQPNDKARLRSLVRIMVNMIVRLLADKMDFKDGRQVAHYKHRLLLMLDEFPSLGKLEILQESLAFVAGYGIKCYLICQDINQLKSRETGYGHDESITSNCHVQTAYPPNRVETAEHLSKLTGQTTVAKEQVTTSGRRTSALLGQVSRTIQEVQRPLLTPDECLRMPGAIKNATAISTRPATWSCMWPATRRSTASSHSTSRTRSSRPAPRSRRRRTATS